MKRLQIPTNQAIQRQTERIESREHGDTQRTTHVLHGPVSRKRKLVQVGSFWELDNEGERSSLKFDG
jgi:hypothetical protein